MALSEYNVNVGQDKVAVTRGSSATAATGGATSLGGTIAVRLLIDDAVVTSKQEVYRILEILEQKLMEQVWPPSGS